MDSNQNSSNQSTPSQIRPQNAPNNPKFSQNELTRLIIQSLYALGYPNAAKTLEIESGTPLDSPEFTSLLFDVLAGRWTDCIHTIRKIDNLKTDSTSLAELLIWKQHFLELLGSKNVANGCLLAREVLEKRIAPLDSDGKRIWKLAKSIVSLEGAVGDGEVVGSRLGLLLELVEILPRWVRVPGRRLEELVEKAVVWQAECCLYHNFPEEVWLYSDHECGPERIPSECIQILNDHKNEVWFVQFSHSGEYLASSSSDCTAILWSVKHDDTLSMTHTLKGHMKPVSFVAWSPNDMMILTCGNAEAVNLWDVLNGTCKMTIDDPGDGIVTSCAWFPNSEEIVCGSSDGNINRIFICDVEGNRLKVWEGERIPKVTDLAVTSDGTRLIFIGSNKDIWVRDLISGKELQVTVDHSITSLSLSRDGPFFIINLNSEIHLWNFDLSLTEPNQYRGHRQEKYVIRSCFGGTNSLFIASGSEDSQIYIWRRQRGKPIKILSGHSMTVNCVSWNPTRPHMLASASDDCTVRIWVANQKPVV